MSTPHQPAEPQDTGTPDGPAAADPAADVGLLSDDPFDMLSVARDDLPARAPRKDGTTEEEGSEADGTGPSSPVGRLAATVDRLRREVQEAQAEADGRALIELAKGILVERLGCGPSQAARQLTELTEQAGVTPLEFAVDVINQAARDRLSEVTTTFLAITEGREDAPDTSVADSPAVRLRTAESGALAAHDAQAVADSLLEHALTPLGAEAVAIWALGADGSFTLAGSAGFPAAEAARWRDVPPG
uniref:ANTAR domain-containing protein n=1 Tax=Streptomyces scabiei TaxID=1930 RepID=UPI0013C3FF62